MNAVYRVFIHVHVLAGIFLFKRDLIHKAFLPYARTINQPTPTWPLNFNLIEKILDRIELDTKKADPEALLLLYSDSEMPEYDSLHKRNAFEDVESLRRSAMEGISVDLSKYQTSTLLVTIEKIFKSLNPKLFQCKIPAQDSSELKPNIEACLKAMPNANKDLLRILILHLREMNKIISVPRLQILVADRLFEGLMPLYLIGESRRDYLFELEAIKQVCDNADEVGYCNERKISFIGLRT